jgi:hypothetical protein
MDFRKMTMAKKKNKRSLEMGRTSFEPSDTNSGVPFTLHIRVNDFQTVIIHDTGADSRDEARLRAQWLFKLNIDWKEMFNSEPPPDPLSVFWYAATVDVPESHEAPTRWFLRWRRRYSEELIMRAIEIVADRMLRQPLEAVGPYTDGVLRNLAKTNDPIEGTLSEERNG